jgi:hypothetical protein
VALGKLKLNMQDVKPGERLYLQMSGGLDSTYLAWRLLRDGYRLLVWHCSFMTHQNRWPYEDAAYSNVTTWLRHNGLTEFDELPQGIYSAGGAIKGWRLDYTFLWPEAGFHLRNQDHRRRAIKERQDIRYIVIPDHAESLSVETPPLRLAYETMCKNAGRRVNRLHPMSQYNRTQILGDMPTELIEMSWWCRKPKDGEPCHRCNTCKVVDPALNAIR